MRRINYKSDIPPLLLSLKVDENQITVPDCDFIVRFYIEGYEGRHYDCSHIGGAWSNCEPSEDGTKLVCYINNQRLGIGELCAEFHYISPDRRYSDGSQKSVVIIGSTELGVELVEDNGDAVTEAAIDVTLPFIYRTAYEIAMDHGYTGTAEDFYGALASVVGIADAEKKRVTAEITRNANEQERIENEENRLNAENVRVNAEAQRVRNEAIRGEGENMRIEQEEDRKAKFKEITEFISTVRANEGNRESNERERQTNEDTRITEEAKRVEAEKKRAAEFEQQKLDLGGKIDRTDIINDLTTGGEGNALSAEMGKVLAEMIGDTSTYEVEGNLLPFENIVMGKKVTAITKASDNTITPTVTDAEGWAYVIVTFDRTQHLSYGMCGYNLAGESDGFGFFGIVYNSNNGSYYTGNINASIARNANIATYENAKIDAINPNQSAFNIHQIAINIPCSSEAMQDAMANKTLGLFTGSIVPKTTCSTMKQSDNIFDSAVRVFSTVNYLNSNYIAVEPNTKYVMAGAAFVVQTYNTSLAKTGTIYANQQPDYSELQNVYGAHYCTFMTGANDAYIRLNNQIGGTSGVTDAKWEMWQKLTIYKASLGYKPIAPHLVSKDYEQITPRMYDIAFVGDSITFLGWYKQMFTKIAIKSHYANGTNSIAWTSSAMESKFQSLIDAYSNGDVVDDFGETITAPQYIFVFLGTNEDAVAGDMATTMGIPVGSLSPTADRTQAMRKFIYMLRNAFPNTKILGFTPYNNFNQSTIAKMVEVANAVERNYQYLGVKCWNLSKISGIMPDFDTASVHNYLSDGIHPNDAGIELLSVIGVRAIEVDV